MPVEAGRTTSLKKIYNPDNGSQFVEIPVIDSITFIDPYDRYQEIVFTFSNNAEGDREVHVVRVENPTNSSQYVMVERIDTFKCIDPMERYQETHWIPDNVDGEETNPKHFVAHTRTHVKRIYGTDGVSWIETERIDEFRFTDPYDRYQETHYTLSPWEDEAS